MTEKQLQGAVIDAARLLGWRVAHFRPARVMRGGRETYETPVAADGKGFPDLVLVRPPRLIFAEMKAHSGKLSDQQMEWLSALDHTEAEVYIWRPNDWEGGVIERKLR